MITLLGKFNIEALINEKNTTLFMFASPFYKLAVVILKH